MQIKNDDEEKTLDWILEVYCLRDEKDRNESHIQ